MQTGNANNLADNSSRHLVTVSTVGVWICL